MSGPERAGVDPASEHRQGSDATSDAEIDAGGRGKAQDRADGGLHMLGITKVFSGVVALDDVDLHVPPHEAHGLVGENGAGKSTLMKVLTGLYKAERGQIYLGSRRLSINSPSDSEEAGIHVIHQDRQLVPNLSVAESLYLGRSETTHGPFLRRKTLERKAERDIEERLGIHLPGGALIGDLSVAEQQLVQVARSVMASPTLLVLDEPTAALAQREIGKLFEILQGLKRRGISLIYISHYMDELREICETVTVLRNGRNGGKVKMAESSIEDVVKLMIGRDVEEFPERPSTPSQGEIRLQVSKLASPAGLKDVSLAVHAGEIVGLTGLIGSGADQLGKAMFGVLPSSGVVEVDGTALRQVTPAAMVRRGVAFVPSDRRGEGAAVRMSVAENLTLSSLAEFSKFGVLRRGKEKQAAQETVARLTIRPGRTDVAARDLSGGNQQKVVLGRWLVGESSIFILDSPTSGVDIGSRSEIYSIINVLAAAGAAVLVITQDLPELMGLSDRILVMYRGSIAQEFTRAEATSDAILAASTGSDIPVAELFHVGPDPAAKAS